MRLGWLVPADNQGRICLIAPSHRDILEGVTEAAESARCDIIGRVLDISVRRFRLARGQVL